MELDVLDVREYERENSKATKEEAFRLDVSRSILSPKTMNEDCYSSISYSLFTPVLGYLCYVPTQKQTEE